MAFQEHAMNQRTVGISSFEQPMTVAWKTGFIAFKTEEADYFQ
jgi:hypothetical protein